METETYQALTLMIDSILDNMEEVDFSIGDEDDEVPSECLIPKQTLIDLCREGLKLKALGGMCKVRSYLPKELMFCEGHKFFPTRFNSNNFLNYAFLWKFSLQ